MRVLVISGAPEAITDYLASAGHEVKECLSTDLAPRMAGEFSPDAVIFSEDAAEVPPVGHRDALREIVPLARVVLLAGRENPIVPYAAALGVRDFVFLPAAPAAILHRLENPAEPEEAAALLDGMKLREVYEAQEPGAEELLGKKDDASKKRHPRWKLKRERPKEPAPKDDRKEKPGKPEPETKKPGKRGVVLVLSEGDPSPTALALAQEIAAREGYSSIVDTDPEGRMTKTLTLGTEAVWQKAKTPGVSPRVITPPGGGTLVAWGTEGGDITGYEEHLRLVLATQLLGGVVVISAGGRKAVWRLSRDIMGITGPGCVLAVIYLDPQEIPEDGKGIVALTAGDREEARQAADLYRMPCVILTEPVGESLFRVIDAVAKRKKIPGAAYPDRIGPAMESTRAGLEKALKGCRAAGRTFATGTALAVQVGELLCWLAFFAALALGAIWLAGAVFREFGLTQGFFGTVVHLSEGIAMLMGKITRRW